MLTSLSLFSLTALLSSGVLSQNVTFRDVKVQYQTEDYEVFNVDIDSIDSLKDALETTKISRITVLDKSTIPTIHEDSISDFPQLKILQLRQNGIENIEPGAFKNVPLLEVLRLNGNKLTEIREGVFSNLSLVFLNLDHNSIEVVSEKAFDQLPKLEVLDLSYNRIKDFYPEWLKDKAVLTSVILTYNEISQLPDGTLEHYHNDIDFSNNRIQNVSQNMFASGVRKVGQLWLSDNHIEKWEESLIKGVDIKVFDISRNQLKCLDGDFEHFFVAGRTRIDNNPWNCECLLKIAKWVFEKKVRVSMRSSARSCNSTGEFL
ncbi:hypothetical protein Zmor_027984 [Zophobas morio]|uniref:Uncharacterized protein n=1 Tax=Zophobas morio TaxID=2755281 RepID=A0AA38HRT2_9CUCU|nr:hypothetical protein Zmor_027984 [Zophobas morio]